MGRKLQVPEGVRAQELTGIRDQRGMIVELDRQSWHPDTTALQWTLSQSAPGVLRGPHVHTKHADRLIVLEGELVVGLVDLRRESASAGLRSLVTLDALHALTIPPGVLHGFFSPKATTCLNATSLEFDPSDDLEVRFDDAQLGLQWPTPNPALSDRDRNAPDLATLLERCGAAGLRVIDPPR